MFKKYHYLSHDLANHSFNYCAKLNNILIGFIGIIHFVHPNINNLKKVHRLVILPDYQGVGIGGRFLDEIALLYNDNKFKFGITTSNPALIHSLKKNSNWRCGRLGRMKATTSESKKSLSKASSENRITTSWFYEANLV